MYSKYIWDLCGTKGNKNCKDLETTQEYQIVDISCQYVYSMIPISMLSQLMYLERDSAGGPSNQPIHRERCRVHRWPQRGLRCCHLRNRVQKQCAFMAQGTLYIQYIECA